MSYRLLVMLFILLNRISGRQIATAQTVIFNVIAKAYLYKGTSASAVALTVLVQSASYATVQIPSSLGLDIYQIWIEDQGQRSPSVGVNRPRAIHFDSPEVAPNGPLRIFGRNMQLAGSSAKVRFVASNGTSIAADANSRLSDA